MALVGRDTTSITYWSTACWSVSAAVERTLLACVFFSRAKVKMAAPVTFIGGGGSVEP